MKRHWAAMHNDAERDFRSRIRFVAAAVTVLFVAGWTANFWPFEDRVDRAGSPLGADYGVFYLPGRMVLEGRTAELYSHEAHRRDLHELFPTLDAGDWLPFRYPPWVALAMAPLAALPYVASLAMFTVLSVVALVIACRMLARRLTWLNSTWRNTLLVALVGWPVVWETLLGGQSSLFTLAILSTTIALVDARRFTAAGAVLALATFKPNVLAWFALGFVIRYPRMLRGAIPVGLALVGVSVLTVGWDGFTDYVRLTTQLAAGSWDVETDAAKVHGLGSWVALIAPGLERRMLLIGGLVATVAVAVVWRRHAGDRRIDAAATALLILLNTLANPYVPIYDLTLLAAAFCFAVEAAVQCGATLDRRNLLALQAGWALLCFGPHLSQAGSQALGLQIFPLAVLAWTARQAGLFGYGTTTSESGIRTVG